VQLDAGGGEVDVKAKKKPARTLREKREAKRAKRAEQSVKARKRELLTRGA
jgi:hypothetical protein